MFLCFVFRRRHAARKAVTRRVREGEKTGKPASHGHCEMLAAAFRHSTRQSRTGLSVSEKKKEEGEKSVILHLLVTVAFSHILTQPDG